MNATGKPKHASDNSSSEDDQDVVQQALEIERNRIRHRLRSRTRKVSEKTESSSISSVVTHFSTSVHNTNNNVVDSSLMDTTVSLAARHATPSIDRTNNSTRKHLRFSEPDSTINITPFSTTSDQKLSFHEVLLSLPPAIRPLARHFATKFKQYVTNNGSY